MCSLTTCISSVCFTARDDWKDSRNVQFHLDESSSKLLPVAVWKKVKWSNTFLRFEWKLDGKRGSSLSISSICQKQKSQIFFSILLFKLLTTCWHCQQTYMLRISFTRQVCVHIQRIWLWFYLNVNVTGVKGPMFTRCKYFRLSSLYNFLFYPHRLLQIKCLCNQLVTTIYAPRRLFMRAKYKKCLW